MNVFRRLFGPAPAPAASFDHPILGTLVYDPESGAWGKRIVVAGTSATLSVTGDTQPNPALMDQAVVIARDLADLEALLPSFLADFAASYPPFAAEITGLTVSEVAVWWSNDPHSAMIWFDGGQDGRLWHCTFADGRLSDLAYDD